MLRLLGGGGVDPAPQVQQAPAAKPPVTDRQAMFVSTGQSAMGPFYCPGDQKVYIDLAFYDTLRTQLGAQGDFAQAYVIAHEVGHPVQNLLGVTAKVDAQRVSWFKRGMASGRMADCNTFKARQL